MTPNMRQFELLEDLRPRGQAKAVLLRWSGEEYIRTGDQIELHEFLGSYGDRGDRGYTCFSPESGRWEVMSGLFEKGASWLPY